jgi:hypothetical protein
MNKLKSLFLKIKAKRTIKTYQKPLFITIIDFLVISLVVILIASILGMVIDADYFKHSFFNAIAHFLSCMLTANTITKMMDVIDEHLGIVLLSVVVIAAELVLFSGAVIATLTAAVKTYIDKKGNAKGKIELHNQFVILNWNSKVPDIIHNLMVKGFKESVIILSDKTKEYVSNEIDSLLAAYNQEDKKNKLNLIVKVGNPLLHGDLGDISIANAADIVVMSREDMTAGEDANIANNDLLSLKVLLALSNFDISKDCNIVIETDSEIIKNKIESLAETLANLKEKSIIPVSFNRKIGQIIAQTMLEPRMADIYAELLSFEGFEFYAYGEDEVDDYLTTHNSAIPIIKFHRLFVLAEDAPDLSVTRAVPTDLGKVRTFGTKEVDLDIHCTIFIIGENKKARFIKENLALATLGYGSHFKVYDYQKGENDRLIEDIRKTEGNKKVLILSDDKVSSDSYDANVFVTLIALQTAFKSRNREELSFVTELLDSKNYNSIKDFNIKNAIISNRMMSLMLSQLALNQDSQKFFDGLLTVDTEEGGDVFDIIIKRAVDMVADINEMHFASYAELVQSFYMSFDKKYVLMGYVHDDKVIFLAKDQDQSRPIVIDAEDEFIFIKY